MMPNRKKVIRGLECVGGYRHMEANPCAECGYNECQTFSICIGEIARDALELLKEQESVQFKVTRKDKSYPFWDSVCTGCGYTTCTVKDYWKYCPVCGKPVKWGADGA